MKEAEVMERLAEIPFTMPEPCPICGEHVIIEAVTEWETESGIIIHAEFECSTAPDIDNEEWDDWFRGHWSTPYIDWLPWEQRALAWLKKNYMYDCDEHGLRRIALALDAAGKGDG